MHELGIPIIELPAWPSPLTASSLILKKEKEKEMEGWMRVFKPASAVLFGYEFTDPQIGRDILVRPVFGHLCCSRAEKGQSMSEDEGRRYRYGMYKFLGDALLDYCKLLLYR